MAQTDQKPTEQALMKRDVETVTQLAGTIIKTPLELAQRVRAMQQVAHILSPAVSVAAIPEHIAINTVVVVIDPTFDAKTGRGNDVYFQASIHKSVNKGSRENPDWEVLEASLNANAIRRMLSASGVQITTSRRTDDAAIQNYWAWESRGKIRDFDGSWRELPPGNVEIDLRDTSAQIGEWSAEKWARAERDCEEKKKTAGKDAWKLKPNVGGWTADRVLAARRFGLRLAESKSLNALGRNLGLKQIYALDELKKPFVIFRATWLPDMSDPVTRQMVTAAELGANHLLYPPASTPAALPAGPREPDPHIIDVEPGQREESRGGEPSHAQADMKASPSGPGDLSFGTAPLEEPSAFTEYLVEDAGSRTGGGFYIQVPGLRLLTDDESSARAAHAAKLARKPIYVDVEKRSRGTGDEMDIWILEMRTEKPTEEKL